ncbi:Septin-domain-containing protein [Mucor lusitanicus]|nr:Septin-domain-containing protein [Mucor lusitanicus]
MSEWVIPKPKSLDQPHHKFRMIVCGDSGIGKTSLVHALTSTLPLPEEKEEEDSHHATSPVLEPTEVLSMNADLCVIDTCGYGALLRAEIVFGHVKSYLETQFEKTTHLFNTSIQDELLSFMVHQSSDVLCHVDACLYLIMGRLKPVDLEYMRSIHDLVNIIPVIIQPDLSLRPEAMIEQRIDILNVMHSHAIKFSYLGYGTFQDLLGACRQPSLNPHCPPFVLDWSTSKKSSFHGLLPLKQALLSSKSLKSHTTQKFMAWKQHLCNSFSTNASSSTTTTTSSSSSSLQQQEQQKNNIRISQYVSKRRHSMEKEMLLQEKKLRQEFQLASKQRRSELILKEINALVQQDSNNKLLIRYQQQQPQQQPAAQDQQMRPTQIHPMTHSPFWIALSIFLSIFICYQNWNWWTYY